MLTSLTVGACVVVSILVGVALTKLGYSEMLEELVRPWVKSYEQWALEHGNKCKEAWFGEDKYLDYGIR